MEKICLHCNTPFTAKRSTGKYCSDTCRVATNRGNSPKPVDNQPETRQQQAEHWATATIEQAIQKHGLENTKAFFIRQLERFIILGK